ncbi:thiamine phosphate synthase [Sphingomonas parva]|uniref:Thiamine phosphate synthase n=1 Tax=Sphingomonas parva TaxID=2555898 RepID=A0A4Y8ZXI6_9SPHN|nr:thiamine phosphate synthase [Sphingomonas parva]TFI59549.1 thiamine phosphate synthase [Sphingomonas parva]
MPRRQPLPRLWLMTDERLGERLWAALERLPRGAGVVFRYYSTPPRERRTLFAEVRRVARRRGLMLIVAGPRRLAGDGVHNRQGRGLRTASAHDLRELRAAERAGAGLVFLSPVFPTRSHPGARPLGRARFGLIAGQARVPVVALGGVDARNARTLPGAYGWAAIDAWC